MTARAFTLDAVEWAAWLPTVSAETASPAQLAALEASPPSAKTSPYFLTLAHDVAALAERSPLFDRIMYAPRGLPRAEREFATVVTSYTNGCIYCAAVHARRFVELTKRPDLIERFYEAGPEADLPPRLGAIARFAARLASTPGALRPEHLKPLRDNGLDDAEVVDLIHAVAMFAWANRLMQTLGEPVLPGGD